MPKKIQYIDQEIVIADYEKQHRYSEQDNVVNGIPIDPVLRPGFDQTPNDEREGLEISDWWNKPFIVTASWDDLAIVDEIQKANWYERWSTGTRYELRCLNGGAWDRSTSLGMFSSLEDALEIGADYVPPEYSYYMDVKS